jgi:hypothetical protein
VSPARKAVRPVRAASWSRCLPKLAPAREGPYGTDTRSGMAGESARLVRWPARTDRAVPRGFVRPARRAAGSPRERKCDPGSKDPGRFCLILGRPASCQIKPGQRPAAPSPSIPRRPPYRLSRGGPRRPPYCAFCCVPRRLQARGLPGRPPADGGTVPAARPRGTVHTGREGENVVPPR